MRRSLVWLFLLGAVTAQAAENGAPVPTNLQLLGRATQQAVEEALEGVPLEGRPSIMIRGAEQNRGNWFIEEYLVEALQGRGVSVRAGGVAPPAVTAPADTSGGAGGQAPAIGQEVPVGGAPGASAVPAALDGSRDATSIPVLEYRIVDLAMRYAGGGRRLVVGSRHVDREAMASLRARLLDGATHEILWVGSGDARESDRIRGASLRDVEASAYPCDPPKLDSRGLGRLVEPAVVTAIVAGLVYLFYTNQN